MAVEIFMPRLGLTMKEGTIVSWHKSQGDHVSMGEVVAEITSEKIAASIEAPITGILEKILFAVGDVVPSGTVIAYMTEAAEQPKASGGTPNVEIDNTTIPGDDRKIKEVIPLAGVRKVIAQRMEESLKRSPQATVAARADLSPLLVFKDLYAGDGIKYSITDLFVKIAALALVQNPILNSSLQDDKIIVYDSINIGIAMAVDNYLLVPVIKNVQEKSLPEISSELSLLVKKAREGALAPEDMTGGTFTLSNLGMFAVDTMTPILNPPEAALLAIGCVRKEAVIGDNDSLSVRQAATLSLTIDHAVTDGVPAARFLETIQKILANPAEYLL